MTRICQYLDCTIDITNTHHRTKYCTRHRVQAKDLRIQTKGRSASARYYSKNREKILTERKEKRTILEIKNKQNQASLAYYYKNRGKILEKNKLKRKSSPKRLENDRLRDNLILLSYYWISLFNKQLKR